MTPRPNLRSRRPAATRPPAPPREPVDVAIAAGADGRASLPAELLSGYDAVIDAFTLFESGLDDAAREKLNAIGLSSPFLQWKLLLRGLMAYVAGDDGRALDNWARLNDERLPARLVAPLRAAIDQAFRAAQPPARQAKLRDAADRLRGGSLQVLRTIQAELGRPERLPLALKTIKNALPIIRRAMPELEAVLARCSYSAALAGHPDGAWLLKDVFGPPADDPALSRLQALAAEQRREWSMANRHWQHFESALAEHPGWSAADRDRARALIWCRCGENAVRSLGESSHASMRAKPNAEQCFRKAIAIDSTFEEGFAGLFTLCKKSQPTKALAIGRQFVARFPEHVPAIVDLAYVAREQGELNIALDCVSRAQALNPFDRKLTGFAEETLRARARRLCAANKLEQAFADLAEAERFAGRSSIGLLAQRAVVALRAGDANQCADLAVRAREQHPIAAAFALAAESAQAKLPRPARKSFDAEFETAVSIPGDFAAALAVASVFVEHAVADADYVGFKSHMGKVKKFIERASAKGCDLATAEQLCQTLETLHWPKILRSVANAAVRAFPRDPAFVYFQARSYTLDKEMRSYWRVDQMLDRARHLAQSLPAGDARGKKYFAAAAALEEQLDRETRALPLLQDILDLFDE